jgi:hypothetical protein
MIRGWSRPAINQEREAHRAKPPGFIPGIRVRSGGEHLAGILIRVKGMANGIIVVAKDYS